MVLEHRSEYPSLWDTIESIANKIDGMPQTLNAWAGAKLPDKLSPKRFATEPNAMKRQCL